MVTGTRETHAPVPHTGTVHIHLVVWGLTDRDIDRVIAEAQQGWGRETWQVEKVTRHTGGASPIKVGDPKAIATAQHHGCAYAAYSSAYGSAR